MRDHESGIKRQLMLIDCAMKIDSNILMQMHRMPMETQMHLLLDAHHNCALKMEWENHEM